MWRAASRKRRRFKTPHRCGAILFGQNNTLVVDEELAIFAEPDGDFKWNFVGFGPAG